MTLWTWDKTANNNATFDSTINWRENQLPSTINDSGRAMMAAVAKWRDDIAGIIVGAGTGTAYTLSSNQVFTSNLNGSTIQFTPGSTNTGPTTLSLDGQTPAPLRFLTGVDLPAGVLISGSLYQASFRSATSEWLLHSSPLAAPFLIPLGGIIDYGGAVAPNANFILPQGQAISTTTYAALFALFGTTYNTGGEPGGTFRVPDLVGRVVAMLDAGSARLSASFFGGNPANLGAFGGNQSAALTPALVPTLTSSGSASLAASVAASNWVASNSGDSTGFNVGGSGGGLTVGLASGGTISRIPSTGTAAGSVSVTSTGTGGASVAHNNVQPTVILNKLLRAQ